MNFKLASGVVGPPELPRIASGNINVHNNFGNLVVFTKAKHMLSLFPSNSAPKCTPNRNKCLYSPEDTCKNIHYSQTLERIQMCTSSVEWINKWCVITLLVEFAQQ